MESKETVDTTKIIYSRYLAVKQHFGKDYDFWKYNGKVSENFLIHIERKKEFYICLSLYKKYTKLKNIEKLFVLNATKNNNFWMGSINHTLYDEFEKFTQSSEYIFKKEISNLFINAEYNKKFNVSTEYPHTYIFFLYEEGLVKLETLIILNLMTKFLDIAHENGTNDFIFESEYNKIKKYEKFLVSWEIFDILKYKRIVKDLKTLALNKNNN